MAKESLDIKVARWRLPKHDTRRKRVEKIDERTQMLWDDIKKSSVPATGILAKGASVWRDRQNRKKQLR